jgi:hypothetical protein
MMVSAAPDKYDPYVAAIILIVVLSGAIADTLLFAFWGQPYTISAYLRRIFAAYPEILAVVAFCLGGLFSHILFVR